MTASMFQGEGGFMDVVGQQAAKKKKPHPPIQALEQGSANGKVMSDMQRMLSDEQKQHEETYRYAHGSHASDNVPLGKASF